MNHKKKSLIELVFQKLRYFAGVAITAMSISMTASFAQTSPAETEALMDKCFDRKVQEERQRGGSVFGTMIPALLGECKTEIDAASIAHSGPKAPVATTAGSSLPSCNGNDSSSWTMCFGTQEESDGRKYVGEWRDGAPDGFGTIYHPDSTSFTGQWKSGRIDQLISCVGPAMCSQK